VTELAVTRTGPVLVVTINRPEVRNAISASVARGIADAMEELDRDEALRAGVLTGAGGYFSAGMDLKAFAATGERPHVPGRGFGGLAERSPEKPLIAAVEGFALAGAFELALACDLIVAGRGTLLGLPEVKRGLMAAAGGLLRLPHLVPRTVAMELALTGEPITAERAAELGVVNRLTEAGEALAAAVELAQRIGANAPLAVVASKRLLLEMTLDLEAAWRRQREVTAPVFASEDAREGAAAFTEKRPAVWRGR
jgi:enoyl-CoA hydratase